MAIQQLLALVLLLYLCYHTLKMVPALFEVGKTNEPPPPNKLVPPLLIEPLRYTLFADRLCISSFSSTKRESSACSPTEASRQAPTNPVPATKDNHTRDQKMRAVT